MIISDFAELIKLCYDKGVLKRLVFSRPLGDSPEKISGRLCDNRGRKLLALEMTLPGNTVSQRNLGGDSLTTELCDYISKYRQVNLITTVSDAEYKLGRDGKAVFLGADKLKKRLTADKESFQTAIEALDKRKNYILSGDEPFLVLLGVSDKNGRVHDKRQGKFRQINKFLEYVEQIYPKLRPEGTLTVYDLCCGKSYLSFSVYYYLTALKGRSVKMLGVDLKSDVIDFCRQKASELGFCGMTFVADDITNTPKDVRPDLVISLHACDVATDIVLDTAVSLGAEVILSTPCCHRNLFSKINTPELKFVTKYSSLKGKLCDALTDALRLERLSAFGYEVMATELVDPEDTPKNILLRAVRSGEYSPEAYARYLELLKFLMGDGWKNYLKSL